MCAQVSNHNVISKYSTTNIDLTEAVMVNSNIENINPDADYRFDYTLADVDNLNLVSVRVFSGDSKTPLEIMTRESGRKHTAIVTSDKLVYETTYRVELVISFMEKEMTVVKRFRTQKRFGDFVKTPNYKYSSEVSVGVEDNQSIRAVYAEESTTGDVPSFDGVGLTWWRTDRNQTINSGETTVANPMKFDEDYVAIRISKNRLLIDGYVDVNGQKVRRLAILEADALSSLSTFLSYHDLPKEEVQQLSNRVNEITYIPHLDSVMYSYTPEDGVTVMEMMNVDTMVVTKLVDRPDGFAKNMVIRFVSGNKVLVAGGNQNGTAYLFDLVKNQYDFVGAIPNEFANTSLISVPMKNGNILLVPHNNSIGFMLIYQVEEQTFVKETSIGMARQYLQVIKTNNEIFITDKNGVKAHLNPLTFGDGF
jgi:hypothetical protein